MTEVWQHGTDGGYVNHFCRCSPCTEAHRVAVRAWLDERRAAIRAGLAEPPSHGRYGYSLGCRCEICTEAEHGYQNDRYQRRKGGNT